MPHNFKVIRRDNHKVLQNAIMKRIEEMSHENSIIKVESIVSQVQGENFEVFDGSLWYPVKFKRHEIINEVKILANEGKLKLGEYRKNITERTVSFFQGYTWCSKHQRFE